MNETKKEKVFWFSAVFIIFVALVYLVGCGKEIIYINSDGKPVNPGECLPKPVADAGPDMYIAHGEGAPIADEAQIGTKLPEGLTATWEPADDLSDPHAAQPIASPERTTLYTLTVRSPKCGTEAKSAMTVHVLKEGKRAGYDEIVIDGEKYFTGYNDAFRFVQHYRATYLHMGTGYYGLKMGDLPEELDLTPPGFHVNRQPRGSCWAEGARSCAEATYHYVTKKHEHVSTQRVIDCSGFGSAASGGQIAVKDMVTHGLVREADYPYTGYDARCKKDVAAFHKANRHFFLKGASGGDPTWEEMKAAHVAFGASEDCGNAGAMRSGGWVKTAGGGGTNHCYGGFGYRKHPTEGWECKLEQNSWGTGWGGGEKMAPGQGCYGTDSDGVKGNIVAEIAFLDMGSPCPPPKADAGPDKTILQIPGLPQHVKIGTPRVGTQTYKWSVLSGDTGPSVIDDADIAETIVRPQRTTRFKLTVTNECATAHAEVTVHVWRRDSRGRTVEVK